MGKERAAERRHERASVLYLFSQEVAIMDLTHAYKVALEQTVKNLFSDQHEFSKGGYHVKNA